MVRKTNNTVKISKVTNSDKINLPEAKDYYDTTGKKVADFFVGIFIGFTLLFTAFILVFPGVIALRNASDTIINLIYLGGFIAYIGVAIYIIKKNLKSRRYIAVGLISSSTILLLITGGCISIISSL